LAIKQLAKATNKIRLRLVVVVEGENVDADAILKISICILRLLIILICAVNIDNKCRYYPLSAFEILSVLDLKIAIH
jgi:hypothetical protein